MNLKFIYPIVLLTLLSSCGKKDETNTCGNEDFLRYTAFPIMTPSVFIQYQDVQTFGDAMYQTFYTSSGGQSEFTFQTQVEHVCSHDDLLVSPTLVLDSVDANLKDTLLIFSTGGDTVVESIVPSNSIVYQVNESYTFSTSNDETNFTISNRIAFPAQGSYSDDSAYFFGDLQTFSFRSQYKTTTQ